nr:dockerin type I repeat-containing protein [candidate division Zixibacteria bacterium]
MRLCLGSLGICFFFLIICCIFILIPDPARAQFPDLVVRVNDTSVSIGQDQVIIPVSMSNYADTIAGFLLTLDNDRPDLLDLANGVLDTTGTLVSGWQVIYKSSYGTTGIQITAIANATHPPYVSGIAYPQVGEIPLVKIVTDISTDSLLSVPQIATIEIIKEYQYFNFSDPNGKSIGLAYDTILDTSYYNCLEWEVTPGGDTVCNDWEEVPEPPADTTVIGPKYINHHLDTSMVYMLDGEIIFPPRTSCQFMGDANDDGVINILDVTYMINYLYRGASSPPLPDQADVNCSCQLNILDATCILSYIYSIPPYCSFCSCQDHQNICGD